MTSTPSKTLIKGLTLLRIVAERNEPMSLADLTERTGWPKPTTLRVLATLVEQGMLWVDDGHYRLGIQCLVLGSAFLSATDVRRDAAPVMRELAEITGETCHLGVRDGVQVVYIEKIESRHSVRMHSWVGATNPLYCTGVGKAILAFSRHATYDAVVRHGLVARTPSTITDPHALREELAAIRECQYAIDDEENEDGIRCAAAPILDHRGEVIGGMSVTAPTFRFPKSQFHEMGELIAKSASRVSQLSGYRPSVTA